MSGDDPNPSAAQQAAADLLLVDAGARAGNQGALIRALRAGGFSGRIVFVTSGARPDEILAALREGLDAGGGALAAQASRPAVARPDVARPALARPSLTPREGEVLELLSTGASYAEIGRELGIRTNTVRTHIRSLYDKLGVENRAEAINLAWSLGLMGAAR